MICFLLSLSLTFLELDKGPPEKYAGEEVSILGFLVCNEQQEWFLARQPNIKSCCISKSGIRLPAEFSPKLKNQIVRVAGVLKTDPGLVLENPVIDE